MTKIVYNACYGGFSLSKMAVMLGKGRAPELFASVEPDYGFIDNMARHEPVLVQLVEELGPEASGSFADLRIRDIPAGTKYRIDEYDGNESVITIDEYEWTVAP